MEPLLPDPGFSAVTEAALDQNDVVADAADTVPGDDKFILAGSQGADLALARYHDGLHTALRRLHDHI